jgi:hypothetical protein
MAEEIWAEMVAAFPQYVEFGRNLDWVRGVLGELG